MLLMFNSKRYHHLPLSTCKIFKAVLLYFDGQDHSYLCVPHKKSTSNYSVDSSVSKESACDSGDLCLIPGSGRSIGEEIGYALQYSWASFVVQLVKNLPAVWETWV